MDTRCRPPLGLSICTLLGLTGLCVSILSEVPQLHAEDPQQSRAGDWPQFLGPDRTGISHETQLLTKWPAGGPAEIWRTPGGTGMSGLAIQDGRLVTMLQSSGQQVVLVLDAATGRRQHVIPVAPNYRNQMGNGPRATPAIQDAKAYAYTGEGVLVAVDLASGSLMWKTPVLEELGAKPADYGMASSPLVVGKLVLVIAGSSRGTLVACDRTTGRIVWKSGSDRAGYSSPALRTVGGRLQVVSFTGQSVIGVDPESGTLLWRFPYETDYDCNIATPISYQNRLFVSAGENHGSALLELQADAGTFRARPVWTSFGRNSALRNEWQTSILLDNHLYGLDNVGSAGPVTHLNCVDIRTGKRIWQKTRFGKSNLIAADGKLFFTTMKGELV
ncbi:MAG: PQQ-binding-like beta-propeller repeat protein, partial [Planctomycetaceae bacterium]